MKRILPIALMIFCLAACGGEKASSDAEANSDPAAQQASPADLETLKETEDLRSKVGSTTQDVDSILNTLEQ